MNRNGNRNTVPWNFGPGTVIGQDRTVTDNGTRNGNETNNYGVAAGQNELLDRIRALSFAALETGLYLDGHPNNRTALAYYTRIKNELDAAVGEYEMTYGPLSHMSSGGDETKGWQWVKQPWPWEVGYPRESDHPIENSFPEMPQENRMTMPENGTQETEG